MRCAVGGAVGVLAALLVSFAVEACGDCREPIRYPLASGTYTPTAAQFTGAYGLGQDTQYSLVIADDFKSVTETFSRNGKRYEYVYAVTKREDFSGSPRTDVGP